ncbi:MAG: prepilin-type N-terminal cleavage/methylation domain-containing protein [Acholeplasmataceae bacterium]|jgi:prepilin-type N-terminal cleavage/methylation domain-containing protein|nr:prepilin-type N-terminal cleavage/methylation domain-containing protein [Acholeplasmataceae bacterium]
MTKTLRSKKGVTLVELLAVIVILGIIAAIAVPAIGGLIDRQRENAADRSYEGVIAAAELYATENALAQDAQFTLANVIAAGFLEENPFTGEPAVVFEVGAAQSVSVFSVDAAEADFTLEIDGYTVFTGPVTP